MQGQRSVVGSLTDSINFDYESPTTNVDIDPQACWNNLHNPAESRLTDYRISDNLFMGTVNQEGQTLNGLNVGESSARSHQNLVTHDEHLTQIGWSPPINTSVRTGLRFNEPANHVSQPVINLNLSTDQTLNGPSFVRGSNSSTASQNFDLNEGHFHQFGHDIGFESKIHPSTGSSLDPFASSGSGRFLIGDIDGRPGSSSDGRRLSCKRKTIEGNVGQSSRAEGSMWRAIPPHLDTSRSLNIAATPEMSSNVRLPDEVNPRLGLGMSGRSYGDGVRPVNVPSGVESSHRNSRLRMNPSVQQDSMSNNSFLPMPISVTRHSDIPLRFNPINPHVDLMSSIPSETSVPQNQSVRLRNLLSQRINTLRSGSSSIPEASLERDNVLPDESSSRNPHIDLLSPIPSETSVPQHQSATLRNMLLHRRNLFRSGSSSTSAVSLERDDVLSDESSSRNLPRNIGEHPMFAPPVEARSLGLHPTNWNPVSGTVEISRNAGSNSRSGPTAGPQSSGGSSRVSSRSQYSRRLSEYVRRSLLSTIGPDIAGQINSNNQDPPVPPSLLDGVPPSNAANLGSRSALWRERQGDGADRIPYMRALAAAGEGRSRIVSEIRNALNSLRRGEGLRIEDLMLLDQSVFFGRAEIHDQHRDMRLDVDNMSYEELLALEERIGNVCTGLTEETILKCMKQRKHFCTLSNDQTETEPCCVCQEVYKDGEDIGTLDCGHDFHRECVKQWLLQKNLCPICKTTGLAT